METSYNCLEKESEYRIAVKYPNQTNYNLGSKEITTPFSKASDEGNVIDEQNCWLIFNRRS